MRAERRRRDLAQWISWATPVYQPPTHLQPFLDLLHRIRKGEAVRAVIHAPPRHAKTETVLHFIPWWLSQDPTVSLAYVSYNADIAKSKSRKCQAIAKQVGIELVTEALHEWRTPKGGGLLATGIGGALTGYGVQCLIVDDPIKNRVEAESPAHRERVSEWLNDVGLTRVEPGGSALVFMTRWHPDDLAGRCIKDKGWQYIRLPALDAHERALWPERWPASAMKARREEVGEYTWASLFQGVPRARGGTVFGQPHTWTVLPTEFKVTVGIDLAYSKKRKSDWSVAVVMLHAIERDKDGKIVKRTTYVVEVIRVQLTSPEFKVRLANIRKAYPTARFRFYASGVEKGAGDFIKMDPDKIPLEVITAVDDKFIRAQPYAAAWNRAEVLVPAECEKLSWTDIFVAEHAAFTGVDDPQDDQVDAGAAGYDAGRASTAFIV